MDNERDRDRLREVRADLMDLERRYGMTSTSFYAQYEAGKTDDRLDFVEWASLVQIAWRLEAGLEGSANDGDETSSRLA